MPSQFSSTAQDLPRGKATEINFLNGPIVRHGKALKISILANSALWALVKLVKRKAIDEASDTSLHR